MARIWRNIVFRFQFSISFCDCSSIYDSDDSLNDRGETISNFWFSGIITLDVGYFLAESRYNSRIVFSTVLQCICALHCVEEVEIRAISNNHVHCFESLNVETRKFIHSDLISVSPK